MAASSSSITIDIEKHIASRESMRVSNTVELQPMEPVRYESASKFVAPRNYNDQEEVEKTLVNIGVKKSKTPVLKLLYLGLLAGFFVGIAGIASLAVAGGFSKDLRAAHPAIAKLMVGFIFPMGIEFIVVFGGELFTGNNMVLLVAFLAKKVDAKHLLENWILVLLSNFFGACLTAYLFGYLTNYFTDEPFNSYVTGIAVSKTSQNFGVVLLRAIPCNVLVCMSILFGLSARDMTGKLLGLWLPIFGFAIAGFEHCIANCFFIPLGMMYGANVSVGDFLVKNLIPVVIGNVIGGGLLIGGSEYYLYKWENRIPIHHPAPILPKVKLPVHSEQESSEK
eukprot:GILJ01002557.1.p1 GENE.GILJ01002557.1~~GILJ01002557.1.p1  ORF type:complete len:337 (-),score=43.17 GILJ01002557.1:161-1171(-)